MTIEIKNLVSTDSVLIDLTDAESSKVNGGYTGIIIGDTGNPVLATEAAVLVLGKPNTRELFNEQARIGVPLPTISAGSRLANVLGGGRYTLPVTSSKLEG